MQNSYLIPANSKRSMLILSLFAPIDLMILGAGSAISLIMIMAMSSQTKTVMDIMFMLMPVIVCAAMVIPVPNHRNLWQLTVHVYSYLMSVRQYAWKGWCFSHGGSKKQR
jgi:hypothetical protein